MRSTRMALVVSVGLASLACAGLPTGEDVEIPEEPAADLPALDTQDPTPVTVATLEPAAEGCAWVARTWPGDTSTTLASLQKCPEAWVATADEGHAAMIGAEGGALVLGDVASPLPAPPAAPQAAGFSGDELVICARDEETLRSWKLADGAWVEAESAPVPEGDPGRSCTQLPAFPDAEVASAPPARTDEGATPAEGAAATALKALKDAEWAALGDWSARTDGAVAWRPEGGPWKLVDGVTDATFSFARGPWLLLVDGTSSRLLDARTGQEAWKADTVASLWPEGVTVPEGKAAAPEEGGAEEPEEPGAPAGPAGPRAKAKRPPGVGPGPGKAHKGKKAAPGGAN